MSTCDGLVAAVAAVMQSNDSSSNCTITLACGGTFDCVKVGAQATAKTNYIERDSIAIAGPPGVSGGPRRLRTSSSTQILSTRGAQHDVLAGCIGNYERAKPTQPSPFVHPLPLCAAPTPARCCARPANCCSPTTADCCQVTITIQAAEGCRAGASRPRIFLSKKAKALPSLALFYASNPTIGATTGPAVIAIRDIIIDASGKRPGLEVSTLPPTTVTMLSNVDVVGSAVRVYNARVVLDGCRLANNKGSDIRYPCKWARLKNGGAGLYGYYDKGLLGTWSWTGPTITVTNTAFVGNTVRMGVGGRMVRPHGQSLDTASGPRGSPLYLPAQTASVCACTRAYTHTHTRAHARTQLTRTHARARTHAHARAHKHARKRSHT